MQHICAGYGETIITPGLPCALVGYGYYLNRKAYSVLDNLKVRVVFLRDKRGNSILLISVDLIGLTIDFSDLVRDILSKKHNLPLSNIFISCTHTHSGPASMFLRGLAEPDANYMAFLQKQMLTAVSTAVAAREQVHDAKWNLREIEPIGFNRVTGTLKPLDHNLGIVVLKLEKSKIYIVNYACHPVVLGVNRQVSADFPGRVCSVIEQQGNHCIFLQGFCGNVDPLVNKAAWGSGSVADIEFYGRHIAEKAMMLEKTACNFDRMAIAAEERRLKIPYMKTDIAALEAEFGRLCESDAGTDGCQRFLNEWFSDAKQLLAADGEIDCLENVPVNVITIGDLTLAGYPGEVYCELGLRLRKCCRTLFPIGNNNGNIGYIPTSESYEKKQDYACYKAPGIYQTFPFSRDVGNILLMQTEEILKEKNTNG